MRIGMLTGSLSRRGAGVFEAVRGLSESLSQIDDVEVEVFGLLDAYTVTDAIKCGESRTHAFPVIGPQSYGYARGMARNVSDAELDVLHLHGLWMYTSPVCASWAKKTRKRYMVSIHGMLSEEALKRSKMRKQLYWRFCQHDLLREAACLHATAESEYRSIREMGLKVPVATIPHGIEIPRWTRNERPTDERTILYLGRLDPIKGLDVLLQAWSVVEREYTKWNLKILGPGKGTQKEKLLALQRKTGSRRVRIGDAVYGPAKDAAFNSADIFILPSRTENFGITIAEALAHGVPVIASKACPWEGLVTNSCGWWVGNSQEELVRHLREALSLSEEELLEMGARGREWMRREFSWQVIAQKMYLTYKWIVEGGVRPVWIDGG